MKCTIYYTWLLNSVESCNFSFTATTKHRLAVPSVVEDKYSWYELNQTLKGWLFLLGNLEDVSEVTKLLLELIMGHL